MPSGNEVNHEENKNSSQSPIKENSTPLPSPPIFGVDTRASSLTLMPSPAEVVFHLPEKGKNSSHQLLSELSEAQMSSFEAKLAQLALLRDNEEEEDLTTQTASPKTTVKLVEFSTTQNPNSNTKTF